MVTLTLSHPSSCNASKPCVLTLSADSTLVLGKSDGGVCACSVRITFHAGMSQLDVDIFAPAPGIDIHATPLAVSMNFLDPVFAGTLPTPGNRVDLSITGFVIDAVGTVMGPINSSGLTLVNDSIPTSTLALAVITLVGLTAGGIYLLSRRRRGR